MVWAYNPVFQLDWNSAITQLPCWRKQSINILDSFICYLIFCCSDSKTAISRRVRFTERAVKFPNFILRPFILNFAMAQDNTVVIFNPIFRIFQKLGDAAFT